jgi:hypothetical protein
MGFIEKWWWKSKRGKAILDYLPEAISALSFAEVALHIGHHEPEAAGLKRLRLFCERLQARVAGL